MSLHIFSRWKSKHKINRSRAWWEIRVYVPQALASINCEFCLQRVFMFFDDSEKNKFTSLKCMDCLVFPCEAMCFRVFVFWRLYRVSQEERAKLRESVPYVKLYRYNPKHLCPKLNGYGDKGQRKVWSFCGSTYCTWFEWRNTHTLRIVCPCLQLTQARSSLRLHM